MVLLQKKLYFSKDRGARSRGSNFSKGWGGGGSRVQVLISIEIHITCDSVGGGGGSGPPITPSGSAHGLIAG